jgi:predicted AlkP superfamily phosphohydrolase/phosphomutase
MSDSPRRVLAIGLDGATFDVLTPLMDAGRLPNLRALCTQGSWGRLRSTVPPLTAPAWTSFATGVNPGKHGIFQFFQSSNQRGPRVALDSVVDRSAIRAPAFWRFLNDAGLRVGLVNVPMTYPPPVVDGFVIAGMPAPLRTKTLTYPAELQKRLPGYRLDLPYFLGGREFQAAYVPAARRFLTDLSELLEERGRHAVKLMREEVWDFFMIVFTETDRMGHYLWSAHPGGEACGGRTADGEATLVDAVVDWYARLDRVLGEVLGAAGPGTAVLVMSDHGMGPAAKRRVYFNDWLRERGYLELDAGSHSNLNAWLWRLGLSRDRLARLAGRLPAPLVAPLVRRAGRVEVPLNYELSRAYYQPIYEFIGGLHIVERPPDIVLGSAAYEELREELAVGLVALRDPATGEPVLERVYRREELYHGPYTELAPDLVLILQPRFIGNHRIGSETLVADRVELSTAASVQGAHRFDGVFIAAGPGLRSGGEIEGLCIEDLAPTTLHLLEQPVPASLDGQVPAEIFEAEVLRRRPVRIVESVTPTSDEPGSGFSAAEERELRRQLEGLGYLN